jgi:hypothetical protein
VVQDIALNLEAIQRPLATLKELEISDQATHDKAEKDLEKAGVVEAVNNCGEACANFSKNLKQWTKHSSSAKLSLRDRLSVGIWNKERIRTFRMQVQSCQYTVQFAIESTQLWVGPLCHAGEMDTNAEKGLSSSAPNMPLRLIAKTCRSKYKLSR